MFRLRKDVSTGHEGDGRLTVSVHDTWEQAADIAMVHYGVPLEAWIPAHVDGYWHAGGGIAPGFRGRYQIAYDGTEDQLAQLMGDDYDGPS